MVKRPDEIKRGLDECTRLGGCAACPYFVDHTMAQCTPKLAADALAYIQQLEAQVPQWISVEERLPEMEGKYIVCTAKGSVYCAKFSTRHGPCFHADMYTHITHWMPMPEPPKEE